MHSKTCCALLLLVLVACQAAPSSKIIEKKPSSETETKLTEENLKPEDAGVDKDRAKKSTTFCVEVHSGKKEVVPCKQEVQQIPVVNTPDYKPYTLYQTAPAPAPVQYPVSNIVVQQPIPSASITPVQTVQPSQVVVQPTLNIPAQPQQSASLVIPQPAPQHIIQVQAEPQQIVVESAPVPQAKPQQPIINIVPAPVSAPCEQSIVQPIPPQQIHLVHLVQPPQPAPPQPPAQQEVQPKVEAVETPAPQYVPVVAPQQQEYECSCRSEQHPIRTKTVPHHVIYSGSGLRSPIQAPVLSPIQAVQYKTGIVGSDDTSPLVYAQAREAEARHHKKKVPMHISVQPVIYNNPPNYPSNKYESELYRPVTYVSPYTFSYPATNYNSYSKPNSPYGSVPLVNVNTGGPYYRNSQDKNSEKISNDKSTQETFPNMNNPSSNQKREASSIQLSSEQKETAEGLPMEKESSIKQTITKTDEI
ncbi:cytoplasmic phosphatidylinositol transfer protein 1 [Lasius niger]|uniref:Cytoplasmic phosphatidylinositol transfer protein 1 n=1 Tax=Lasius niger TaxID=67767 RepID=A0A0J7L103_LASNI|nr:cytoplasmic phosphatidylinositol transfer protein 1 [Lasius niger]